MNRDNAVLIIFGVLALVIGIALKLFIGRRKFYRRSPSGGQGFKNYRNALLTPFWEGILTFTGALLIILGVLALAFAKWML
ncbi:molybdenum ABC transporter permease [Flavobacterium sp. '19STA2R22 D10 B1']|uniref:molybdenum ABC transporter permease n=1 Tax=Flavobacterium aerium TaxID=3037261 RepID=UPI00278C6862|nr:molybdenum ABC transporter permease [Flavobacterium sp. '19STA2R22 D10 B1']